MRALVIVALLASSVHADDYDPLVELRRSFEERDGGGCQDHLASLQARGVPDSTEIYLLRRSDELRRGFHSLARLRVVCASRMAAHARDEAEQLIRQAIRFPWTWAEQCVQRWPLAIAAGAKPTDRIETRVGSRRGMVKIAGTLEQLYVKHCENAYTPRRRGE